MSRLVKLTVRALAQQVFKRENSLLKTFALSSLVFIAPAVSASLVNGQISKVGDATHLEFSGRSNWKYSLDVKSDTEIHLNVPAFDQKTLVGLKTWTDRYIDSVEIDQNGADGQYLVKMKLKGDFVETFDYLTDEPSRLIIDFFQRTEPLKKAKKKSIAKPASNLKRDKRRARLKNVDLSKKIKGKSDRTPSGELDPKFSIDDFRGRFVNDEYPQRGVFDGGDPGYNRFRVPESKIKQSSIIASSQDIFIRFPMLRMSSSELTELLNTRPDYVIKPKSGKENMEARLLLKLYHNKRTGLFFKAYNYFKESYPNSVYDEIVTHLAAEMQFDRFREEGNRLSYEAARSLYIYLLNKYPESPLAERTEFLLGYAELERGSAIPAIQRFERIITNYPRSESLDQARRAQAAAFLIVNRYDDTLKSLKELEKTARYKRFSREANYRIGDVYFQKKDFKKAIKAYANALKTYPEYEGTFPNAHFNMAESYFWRGEFKQALDHYVEFVSRFPNHAFGAYALTRIGENLQILGADQTQVIGAYLESYFRFKDSPGANIARVRMLSQQMRGMKDKELKKVLEEIDGIAERTDLPRIKEFVALMVADGFHGRTNYEKAMELLISYYQKNPTSADLTFFRKKILAEISQVMKQKVENKDYMQALQFYEKFKSTWLRKSPRLDIPYFQGRAFEQAGVFDEASATYNKTLESLGKLTPQQFMQVQVRENLPSNDEIYLRLARTSEQRREYKKAEEFLGQIKAPKKLAARSKVEKVVIESEIAKAKGQTELAKAKLSRLEENWEGDPQLVAPVLVDLAKLQLADGELVDSIQSIEKIEEAMGKEEGLPENLIVDAMTTKGKVLEKQGKPLAAVDTYIDLLNRYESKASLGSVRYRAGGILYKQGDLKGAELVWGQLNEEKDSMFKRLAQERLEDAEWQSTYNRYIERIPAMSKESKE